MPSQRDVTDGVDTDELAAFATHAAENPGAVQLGLSAQSTYEGTVAHSLATIDSYVLGDEVIDRDTRTYSIPYGGWKEVLDAGGWVGPTDRLEPIEVALSALVSCINVGITINAVATGVAIDSLETRVSTDFDPRVLFSVADLGTTESVFENLSVDVEIESPDLDKDDVDEWARRAPVYTLVSLAQDVNLTVNTPAELEAD